MFVVALSVCLLANALIQVDGRVKDNNVGIYGGQPISITEVPFMAIFPHSEDFRWGCGASIVHEQFLVTAAHCIRGVQGNFVIVGTDNINGGQKYDIEKKIAHPQYDEVTTDYDIGVLKLTQQLTFSDKVQAIRMADAGMTFNDGDMFDTMGFGETEQGQVSNVLLKVDVAYVDNSKCSTEDPYNITDRMICAGGVQGQDACKGDSGGPLRFNGVLVGVVSFGVQNCGSAGQPGVYARIPALRDFIDQTINNNL